MTKNAASDLALKGAPATSGKGAGKMGLMGSTLHQGMAAALFLSPFLAVYLIFLVYPALRVFWISLHDWNLMAVAFNPDAKSFVGLDNYRQMFWGRSMEWGILTRPLPQLLSLVAVVGAVWWRFRQASHRHFSLLIGLSALALFAVFGWAPAEGGRWHDRYFWETVENTLQFVGLTVPSVTIVSLALAVLLNRETRLTAFFRTLFFLSQILSVTVVTLIWKLTFSPSQGLLANVMEFFGASPIAWLSTPGFAMAAIVITTVWWSIGIAMVLFLSGLQAIPTEMQEAARLDRANGFQVFWYILLPNLKRTMTLVVVLQIIMHFQVFGQPHLMTNGGPAQQTQTLVRYIYQSAFRDNEMGMASAMAVILFLIIAAFSALQFVIGREKTS